MPISTEILQANPDKFIKVNAGGTDVEYAAGSGGAAWGSITGTLAEQTDLQGALDGKEPANENIQTHVTSSHAPSNAQKNSDILKSEIEAVLTGEIASHTHAGGNGLSHAQVLARTLGG